MRRIDGEIALVEAVKAMGDILGHIDDDGAGPAGSGHREGAAHRLGDTVDGLHADQFLAGGAQDRDLVGFLRHVLARMVALRVAHDGHHWRSGVQRLHQPRHEVRGPGAQRRVHQPHATRYLGIGVGSEGRAAFVVDQVVVQAQPPRGIVEGQ
jgi:hypothetical protein